MCLLWMEGGWADERGIDLEVKSLLFRPLEFLRQGIEIDGRQL
jgi:hypothetical protein